MLVLRRSPKVTATSVEVQVSPATDHLNANAASAARPPAMTSAFSTVGRVFSRNVSGRLKGRPEAPSLNGAGSRPLTTESTPAVDGKIGSAYIRAQPARLVRPIGRRLTGSCLDASEGQRSAHRAKHARTYLFMEMTCPTACGGPRVPRCSSNAWPLSN